MSVLKNLRSFFIERPLPIPSMLDPTFESGSEFDHSALVSREDRPHYNFDLVGETIGIEYVNANGEHSRRWVSVLGFKQSKAGDWSAYGICFTKNKRCQFRLDRIQCIFDTDGEILEMEDVFLFSVEPGPIPEPKVERPGTVIRRACKDGLRLLIALAKVDGEFHEQEEAIILGYAEAIAAHNGLTVSSEDQDALLRYFKNQNPAGEVVVESLKSLDEMDRAAQRELFWYVREVMDADRVQDPKEVQLLLQVSQALRHVEM